MSTQVSNCTNRAPLKHWWEDLILSAAWPSELYITTQTYYVYVSYSYVYTAPTAEMIRYIHTRHFATTHPYAWLDPFICVPRPIHTCDTTHSYVCHEAFASMNRSYWVATKSRLLQLGGLFFKRALHKAPKTRVCLQKGPTRMQLFFWKKETQQFREPTRRCQPIPNIFHSFYSRFRCTAAHYNTLKHTATHACIFCSFDIPTFAIPIFRCRMHMHICIYIIIYTYVCVCIYIYILLFSFSIVDYYTIQGGEDP